MEKPQPQQGLTEEDIAKLIGRQVMAQEMMRKESLLLQQQITELREQLSEARKELQGLKSGE